MGDMSRTIKESTTKRRQMITVRDSNRAEIVRLQALMGVEGAQNAGNYLVNHYFTPIDEKYGCCTYARQVFLPKGHVVVGKIHKHAHLNFLMKGKLWVATEFGKQAFEAPCVIVSPPGVKRAAYIEEDVIWVTVHLTEHHGEDALEAIEEEVIAKSYEEFDLMIEATKQLEVSK